MLKSVVGIILVTLGKLTIGWYGKSEALFADGIYSVANVFASVIVLIGIKLRINRQTRNIHMGMGKQKS